jgi:MFS family permease
VTDNPKSIATRHLRRNYTLGVLNGTLFGLADNLASPYLVLSPFVDALGGSHVLVGLLPAIYNGGWFFPQFLISHRLQQMPLKLAVYDRGAWFRGLCWSILTAAVFIVPRDRPEVLLALFFSFYVLFSFAAGFTGAAFMDIVAKVIPANRRGTFFGRRDLGAALSAIAAGLVIRWLLDPTTGVPFPLSFGWLFLLSGVSIVLALGLFHFVVEPAERTPNAPVTFRYQLSAAGRVLRCNHFYRRYLVTRGILAIADIATPFYAIYATDALHAPLEIVGSYLAFATLASLISNPLLCRLGERRGLRSVLLVAAGGMVAMPLVALALGLLPPGPILGIPFGLVFVVNGITRTAGNIAFPSMLLEIAPAQERALYIGFTNTMLGVASFLPTLGGVILDLAGYRVMFGLTLGVGFVGFWLGRGMKRV